ncbi:MAG TPA: PHB depolymerase family esterase [Pseudolysinimonas sp.]
MRRPVVLTASAAFAVVVTLALSACVARHPEPAPTSASYPVGTSLHTLTFDGEPRQYRVYVPRSLDDTVSSLVVMLHGGFGSGEQAELSYGWDRQAETSGLIVAYPEGIGRSWNGGGCCGPAMKRDIDDVGFIEAMVAEIGSGLEVDPTRVFATGMSNGGIMAYRLACESDLFAAIAPVAATMLIECRPPGPVSVLHIHGGVDGSIPPTAARVADPRTSTVRLSPTSSPPGFRSMDAVCRPCRSTATTLACDSNRRRTATPAPRWSTSSSRTRATSGRGRRRRTCRISSAPTRRRNCSTRPSRSPVSSRRTRAPEPEAGGHPHRLGVPHPLEHRVGIARDELAQGNPS